MDVREKLVEMIDDFIHNVDLKHWYSEELDEKLADELIANGVKVQEQNGCEHCRTASYTENPFTVITQMGREVKTQFNFCPNCGRRLPQPPKGE
jgi:hypothetical protein